MVYFLKFKVLRIPEHLYLSRLTFFWWGGGGGCKYLKNKSFLNLKKNILVVKIGLCSSFSNRFLSVELCTLLSQVDMQCLKNKNVLSID